MQNKLILFDIDNTLFNTALYREGLWNELGKLFVPSMENFSSVAEEVYLSLRKTGKYFDTAMFSEALGKRLNVVVDANVVDRKARELAENGLYVYPEVVSVLQTLKEKENIHIGIFSTGGMDLQTAKVASVKHFLTQEHVHIFEDKKPQLKNILQKYNNFTVFLVDDFWRILAEAKEYNPHTTTVWMKRGRHSQNLEKPEGFEPNYTITSLDQLLSLVDRSNLV